MADTIQTQTIAARLLHIYFTGDTTAPRECPKDEAGKLCLSVFGR